MKLILAIVLFTSTLFYSGDCASLVQRESVPFQWRSCSTAEDLPLVVQSIEVSPLPVLIPGNITLSMQASNSRVINNMDMQVTVWKLNTWLGDFRLPCLMGHGSCKHEDLCQLVQVEDDEFVQLAEEMMEAGGVSMECPIQPNTLNLQNFELPLPDLPNFPFIGSAIAGEYKVKVEVMDHATEDELACYEMEVKVEEAPKPEEECTGWFCW